MSRAYMHSIQRGCLEDCSRAGAWLDNDRQWHHNGITCKQLAFVLPISAFGPTSFNSFKRAFRKSHDSSPATVLQHFGLVWSAQRNICLAVPLIPSAFPMIVARSPASAEDPRDDDLELERILPTCLSMWSDRATLACWTRSRNAIPSIFLVSSRNIMWNFLNMCQ